ncbi:hypothetical protein C8J57DRAFT_1235626 [Mycena rebaudengoi]|nr:hypothetical protein C8J57DRAFT_1235626 [Mycena rebaudengoi]
MPREIRTNQRVLAAQDKENIPLTSRKLKQARVSTFPTEISNAMDTARNNLKHIPKKRGFEDVVVDLTRSNLELARERAATQAEHRRQTLLITQKAQLLEMFKLGLNNAEETKIALAALDAPPAPLVATSSQVLISPRTPRTPARGHHSLRLIAHLGHRAWSPSSGG